MIKGFFQFIGSKIFLKHLLIYVLFLGMIISGVLFSLGSYTSHNVTVSVPDFKGIKLGDLDKFVADKKIRYLVIDSVYDVKSPVGVVINQEPAANEKVKDNRTIYLYVTSILPPGIQMPKLIDRSLRQASSMIFTYGLKLGSTKFIPDQCANCVLDQLVKGKKIAPGETIPKGTVIDLVVGKGLGDEKVGVPCLYGLSRKEAMVKLTEASLSIGAITYDEPKDTASTKVYRQIPSCNKNISIKLGGSVDLFFTSDKNKIPTIPTDSNATNNTETENFDN